VSAADQIRAICAQLEPRPAPTPAPVHRSAPRPPAPRLSWWRRLTVAERRAVIVGVVFAAVVAVAVAVGYWLDQPPNAPPPTYESEVITR
jgi:hypothetical protein